MNDNTTFDSPAHQLKGQSKRQVKSKERVAAHGEVFTAEREVNAMLDLVKEETERIDSRFLEPACGDGNFMSAILERKLRVARERYSHSRTEYEMQALTAVCSIYGIEIQQDNVAECRERLFAIFTEEYKSLFNDADANDAESDYLRTDYYLRSVRYVIDRNVVWGDALTLCEPNASARRGDANYRPIIFSEWSSIGLGNKIKRRDFTLDELLRQQPEKEACLFASDDESFLPSPIREFAPVHYWEIYMQS